MHYKEIDFRSAPLNILCTISTNAVAELTDLSEKGLLDGITAMEYAEYFYGALLVACQAYAVGTVSDINDMKQTNHKKIYFYKHKENNDRIYTYIELINALANLFKHNEEWASWPNNETTKILRYYGINENTDFPLYNGIKEIIGESTNLRSFSIVLETWRSSLIMFK